MTASPFTLKVIELIHAIPVGKVATYGGVAAMAGNRRAARQVARILHTCSRQEQLPWHRVINREGKISLGQFQGYSEQKERLENEGIIFTASDKIDLDRFLWKPNSI